MTVYTRNPDVAHLFELEQQVEELKSKLITQGKKLDQVRETYRKARKVWAAVATDEINRSTRAYVDQIKNQQTYITFLERNQP